jgi:hypothetical protein
MEAGMKKDTVDFENWRPQELPVKPADKQTIVFNGRLLEVSGYSEPGKGAYWLVAEEAPAYGDHSEKK